MIDLLPLDLFVWFLVNYIDPISIYHARRVSKTWRNVIDSDAVGTGIFNKYVAEEAIGEIPDVKDKLRFVIKLIQFAKYMVERRDRVYTCRPKRKYSDHFEYIVGMASCIETDISIFYQSYDRGQSKTISTCIDRFKELDISPDIMYYPTKATCFRSLRRIVHTCVRLLVGKTIQNSCVVNITALASPINPFPIPDEHEHSHKLPHYISWLPLMPTAEIVSYFLYNKLMKDHDIPVIFRSSREKRTIEMDIENVQSRKGIALRPDAVAEQSYERNKLCKSAASGFDESNIRAQFGASIPWIGIIDYQTSVPIRCIYKNYNEKDFSLEQTCVNDRIPLGMVVRAFYGLLVNVDGVNIKLLPSGEVEFLSEQFNSLPMDQLKQARYKLQQMVYDCNDRYHAALLEEDEKRREKRKHEDRD
jgi:hypothetical protein